MRRPTDSPSRAGRRSPRARRLGAAVAVWVLGCFAVGAAPAVAADVRIDLPQVAIDAESTTFTVSGTAPVAPPDAQVAFLVVVPQAAASCVPPGPAITLSQLPEFVPSVGQVMTIGPQIVSGAFSERFEFVGATGRGAVCAWLLTQDTPAGLVLGATAAAPIRLLYRLPASVSGFPFIQQHPRQRGATLTAFLGRDHRFTRFQATCEKRGPHEGQRFTLFRRVLPDPTTGAFTATGIARADNSSNYDAPIPAPYRGRARLTVSGRIVPTRFGIRIRGTVTLGGPGLSCPGATLRP